MGTMTWIYQDYPLPKPPPPREPWPEWDFMAERSTGLEPHRRSEPEPAVTLRPEAHANAVERDFFPAFARRGRSGNEADDGTQPPETNRSEGRLLLCREAEPAWPVVPRCKPDDSSRGGTDEKPNPGSLAGARTRPK